MTGANIVIYRASGSPAVMLVAAGVDPHAEAKSALPPGVPFIVEPLGDLPTDLNPEVVATWDVNFDEPDGYGQDIKLSEIVDGGEIV